MCYEVQQGCSGAGLGFSVGWIDPPSSCENTLAGPWHSEHRHLTHQILLIFCNAKSQFHRTWSATVIIPHHMPGEKHREVYWDLERGWCLRAQCKYVGLFWDKSIWIIETKTVSCVRVPVELPGRPGYINGDPSIRGWHGVALLPAELQAVTVKIKEGSQSPLAVKYMNTFFFSGGLITWAVLPR